MNTHTTSTSCILEYWIITLDFRTLDIVSTGKHFDQQINKTDHKNRRRG